MKVIIIDSGIDLSHELFKTANIKGFSILKNNRIDEFNDNIGHGTGVASIIIRKIPDIELLCIKIFDDSENADEYDLINALNYILENEQPAIVHISSGIIQMDNYDKLKYICENLEKNNHIIISSFDNYGAISYPASFESVIGVVADEECKKDDDFIYIENSCVNIAAKGISQTLLWNNNSQMFVSGSSFASPYVTCQIIQLMRSGVNNKKDILNGIKSISKKVISFPYLDQNFVNNLDITNIKKAVIFPFNKEIHSFVRFIKEIDFEILHIYNFKHLGNIGKNTKELLLNTDISLVIENIRNINWEEDFDTFILGHCNTIVDIINFDIRKEIIEKCLEYNKNIFAFDSKYFDESDVKIFKDKGLFLYSPDIDQKEVPHNLLNKLYIVNTPILCVVGTSSKQGKFSLQIQLKNELSNMGYVVGQLGTEPTSELFGMNKAFPIGYNSSKSISGGDAISLFNMLIKKIEDTNCDLIIAGGQSGVIPCQIRNLQDIPYNSYEFLLGTNPDLIILCINMEDDVEYIKRCIKYSEGLVDAKVIALVIFPMKKRFTWSGLYLSTDKYDKEDIQNRINELMLEINLPVYVNGNIFDISALASLCIDDLTN